MVSTRLASIDTLEFGAVLSDLDGVVYRGDEAIPGAVERFKSWHRKGIPYSFITNNAEKTAPGFAEKLNGLGVPCTPNQVVTSGEIALSHMSAHWPRGTSVYCIGSHSLKDRLEEAGFVFADQDATIVLVALDRQFSYDKMRIAVRNVLGGAALIATNPDLLRPAVDGFEPGAGAIAQSIALASGKTPQFMGKPSPSIVHTALTRMNANPAEAILIGDQLETDILAATLAGVRSVLVETGVPQTHASAVEPDYIISSL